MCQILGVDRSSYYRRLKSSADKDQTHHLKELVGRIFWRHSRRYGWSRIALELKAEGIEIGRHRIRRLMKEQGLQAIQPRSFVPKTTASRHHLGYAEKLLAEQKLPPEKPNEVIVGDITYLALADGSFAYLATWMDLYSRLVIGWQVEGHLQESLILLLLRKPCSGEGICDKQLCIVIEVVNMHQASFAVC
jgi:putative transposase